MITQAERDKDEDNEKCIIIMHLAAYKAQATQQCRRCSPVELQQNAMVSYPNAKDFSPKGPACPSIPQQPPAVSHLIDPSKGPVAVEVHI